MTTWFTSDTHFGHANVIKYCDRPFSSVEEMDEAIVTNWTSVIRPDDDVYHLGDVMFHRGERVGQILSRLTGRIHLIRGNHDHHSFLRDHHKRFVSIEKLDEVRIDGTTIVLCHFPMLSWNKSHHGSWHLHGHCHGKLPDDPGFYRLDVGVDPHAFRPLSFDDVRTIMSAKSSDEVLAHQRRIKEGG